MTTLAAEPALGDLSAEDLARRVQRGSSACFAALVGRFERRLYNFLLRRVPTAADAEDLTQETFVRAWRRIETYDPRRTFSTWLFTIAARLASSHRRGLGRDTRRAASLPARTTAPDAHAVSEGHERGSRVWRAVDEVLGEDQRAAVWLRYVEDMPIGDIARVLGKTSVAVRVTLFRARRALAERLGDDETGAVDDRRSA
ncbi:MAG: sigma-70 family RNA polymerase sigma factor [Phycisphaerales bacterium]|nr:sigma-70 family RNA polymerase sigma factor [Phycisphaerales bacterium]